MLAVLVQPVACVREPDTRRAHLRLVLAAAAAVTAAVTAAAAAATSVITVVGVLVFEGLAAGV